MRVLIHYDKAEQLVAPIRQRHPQAELSLCTDYASLPRLLEQHQPEVLFTIRFAGTPGFPRAAIVDSPSLRWVSVGGGGLGKTVQVVARLAKAHGVQVVG